MFIKSLPFSRSQSEKGSSSNLKRPAPPCRQTADRRAREDKVPRVMDVQSSPNCTATWNGLIGKWTQLNYCWARGETITTS